ncbi:MAG: hypothetical protein OHK0029_41610 [Armatimonadaceae bacterium]
MLVYLVHLAKNFRFINHNLMIDPKKPTRLSPTVQYVAQVLEERIHNDIYPGGKRLPSERSLADEFQVSRMVIRQVLDEIERRGLLNREARCRPVVADFVTNGASSPTDAPSPSSRQTISVWLWPGLNNPVAAMVVRGIRQALPAETTRLLLDSPRDQAPEVFVREEAAFLQRAATDRDVSGVLLWYLGGPQNVAALETLRSHGIPMVFLDRLPPEGFDAEFVGIDNVAAAEMATRHLISLGHRRIIHITNSDSVSTVAERRRGFERAMQRAGLPVGPKTILQNLGPQPDDPEWGHRQLYAEILDQLRSPNPPTAAFTVNDYEGFSLLDGLIEAGVRVPEDFSIIGLDGMERWRPGRPTLTTVWQPFERIGAFAVERLLDRLSAGSQSVHRYHYLDVHVVEAETTAPPPDL